MQADQVDGTSTRRSATPGALAPWILELVRTFPGLVAAYSPRGPLHARTRQRVILAVSEANGARCCAWVHGAWRDFLGDVPTAEAEEVLLDHARACARAGRPLDATSLRTLLPPRAVAAVRATVAHVEVANLVESTVTELAWRLTGRRPFRTLPALREAVTAAAVLPGALPLLGAAAVMRGVERLAPPLPPVAVPAEPNLLVHLLASALPRFLANAAVRLAVLGLPVSVPIAVRTGRTSATVRVGRRCVALENGVASDALVLLEGDVGPLLRDASGALLEELGHVRIRRA